MLKKLYIKNYALIDKMCVEFGPGLNILTGETGVGKSIILGALSLLLGERVKTDVIRGDASMAVVEGLFDVPSYIKLETIDSQIVTDQEELLLRREIHQSGRSRSFANDSPISNSVLSAIGDLLIDLHGQHEHQTILKVDHHLDYLDNFGAEEGLLSRVKVSFKQFRSLKTELEDLQQRETRLHEKRELLEFQVQEIAKADPKEGEGESLESEERILRNSERIFQASNQITNLLYDGEGSVSEKLSTAENALTGLEGVDPLFEKWMKECESARIGVEEIVNNIQTFASRVEFNPQRLEILRERLGLFSQLKKKYGGSIEQVLKHWEEAKKELDQIENIGDEIDRVSTALEEEKKILTHLCEELSAQRRNVASNLEKETVAALEELGLKNSVFCISVEPKKNPEGPVQIGGQNYAVSSRGIDTAEFFISLNPGENPKKLTRVASGGEISRIMLALKTVLAEADRIPVMVFDEIDTGISGRIARVVGKNLKEVSRNHQVICITHLPQIASMGDLHFCVEKEVKANRSRTKIRPLGKEERVMEIAKLMGGEKVTESTIQSARELLKS